MFIENLHAAQRRNQSLVCVGLDPDGPRIQALGVDLDAWLRRVVDACAAHCCAFKPQIAHFAALGAEASLQAIIEYIHSEHPGIPVILDSKRGDVGSTAAHYASEAFDRYNADAVTVNPYLGQDSLQPFLDRRERGVIALCKTSNPGSGELQNLTTADSRPVYQVVAERATSAWNANNNVLLVVGATWPEELRQVRAIVGDMPLLIPGIGAQGGDLAATLQAGLRADGLGLVISSSRGIIYASDDATGFADAAGAACLRLREQINRHRD